MNRIFLLLVLLFFTNSQSFSEKRTLYYTLEQGEKIDPNFQMKVNQGKQQLPVIKLDKGEKFSLFLGGKKLGPYKALLKIFRQADGSQFLIQVLDMNRKYCLIDSYGTEYGNFSDILDIKTSGNHWIASIQSSPGWIIVLVDGRSYGPYTRVYDVRFSHKGELWAYNAVGVDHKVYQQTPEGAFFLFEEKETDLIKPERVPETVNLVHSPEWTESVVVRKTPTGDIFIMKTTLSWGPFRKLWDIKYINTNTWAALVSEKGKDKILMNGRQGDLQGRFNEDSRIYIDPDFPGTFMFSFLKGREFYIQTHADLIGPFDKIVCSGIHGDRVFAGVKIRRSFFWRIGGLTLGPFDRIGEFIPGSGTNWAVTADTQGKGWLDLCINGIWMDIQATRVDSLQFSDESSYSFVFKGKDERWYVQTEDGNRWGPFQSIPQTAYLKKMYILDKEKHQLIAPAKDIQTECFNLQTIMQSGIEKYLYLQQQGDSVYQVTGP